MKFLFDLDGTVSSVETLPLIAKKYAIEEEIAELTYETVKGNVPFIESFIRRINILGRYPVSEIADLLYNVPVYPEIYQFIKSHNDDCVIVTGNLRCWCEKFTSRFCCDCFFSEATQENDKIIKLTKILRKEQIVEHYRALGEKVVFIGDGNNDLEAMRHADISIALGITHHPAPSLFSVADYIIYSEKALCRQLNQL